jgi:Zn-dependent M28 family amino/carboxypeptidase
VRNQFREVQSRNVLAKLEGATRPDEYVVYTAHWDHLGRDESLTGDQIFNGALDNASGTALMLRSRRRSRGCRSGPTDRSCSWR